LNLGDWIFPNVHPYFHGELDPAKAIHWTEKAYSGLTSRTTKFVLFKEVGLPTKGELRENLSEDKQAEYYLGLAKTKVRFVYFEAFDLPWKDHLPVEPHWGIFHSDRSAKVLGRRLLDRHHP
jgi:exo-beta-1,3-glucanase (GH17 family)